MIPWMDTVRVGASLRALRRHKAWTQQRLAAASGVSRSAISRIETGEVGSLPLATVEKASNALGARLDVSIRWHGEGLDRLLDEAHATLVDACIRLLAGLGWETAAEVSFNVWGERGSIDVLAFHRPSSIALVVEVKSVVPDMQAMLSTLDRKARVGRTVAAARGWQAASVGRLLVVGRSATSYRRIARHASTLDVALPTRGWAARRWLGEPRVPPVAGLLVVSIPQPAGVGNRNRQRVGGSGRSNPARPVNSRSARPPDGQIRLAPGPPPRDVGG